MVVEVFLQFLAQTAVPIFVPAFHPLSAADFSLKSRGRPGLTVLD